MKISSGAAAACTPSFHVEIHQELYNCRSKLQQTLPGACHMKSTLFVPAGVYHLGAYMCGIMMTSSKQSMGPTTATHATKQQAAC
jgi:hypothetical protein